MYFNKSSDIYYNNHRTRFILRLRGQDVKQIILLFTFLGIIFPTANYGQSLQTVSSNYSPLHWAAAQGYVEMMRVLVDKGYNVNIQDDNGFTPLHYAAAAGTFEGVEFLVNSGSDVYIVNNRNITPMTLAAQAGEQKIVDYLFIKMRSTRVEQLKAHTEQERVSTDLAQAAKARAEAERLRQQASEWTKEAEHWRSEAEKWTTEANTLKDQQVQIDQLAKERYEKIMSEKTAAEQNFQAERLARNAAERLLREQSANTVAQIRAYEAQAAALSAQRATDAAIDNLTEEFLRQGINYTPNDKKLPGSVGQMIPEGYTLVDPDGAPVPVNILNQMPIPNGSHTVELGGEPPVVPVVVIAPVVPVEEVPVEEAPVEGEAAYDEGTYDEAAYESGYDDAYGEGYEYEE